MNLKESIRRILREEIKMPLQLKRRVNNDVLDELIYTVKSLIDSGYDESDAIYDTVRQFIATKQFKLKNDSEQSILFTIYKDGRSNFLTSEYTSSGDIEASIKLNLSISFDSKYSLILFVLLLNVWRRIMTDSALSS